ncbi:vanadium-dependent haloperoxidase [Xanthobacteraceae bacterium Astr-EGSB]|uniref:vanadium-dependent haloperoxidase n=1 Tax=Astrobacterium formosum TaxID=3069710 RepID=UPI0027AE522E|nr:vanadium-dependent haloperoxidase [Xanthobacteraceae bacterium Astr-EGSB]
MKRRSLVKIAATTAALTLLVFGTPTTEAQTLQPQTRQELQRVFGAGERPTSPSQPAGVNPALPPSAQQELFRTFGRTLDLSQSIRMQATPSSTRGMQQLPFLTGNDPKSYLAGWHNISLDVTAIDHSPILNASPATFLQQFGPARAARALALVHLAMFESANRLTGARYESLVFPTNEPPPAANPNAVAAAISESAFQVISWLYPGLTDMALTSRMGGQCVTSDPLILREYIYCSLAETRKAFGEDSTQIGIALGREIAGRIKTKFQGDGSATPEPVWSSDFSPRTVPAAGQFQITQWQIDPVSKLQVALGGRWGDVHPMTLSSSFQFRRSEAQSPIRRHRDKDPTNWDSYKALIEYAGEYRLNSTGLSDPAIALARDGFFVAQLWAYDATAGLCAPGRLYNQIADAVLKEIVDKPASRRQGAIDPDKVEDVARFYSLVNLALGDAAIAAWDEKYHFQFPRPITVIRSTQAKDPNTKKVWYPLGAQVTNSEDGKNISPPFPAYPSGHATFGGALFGVLRQYVADPNTFEFKFLSDEFNGKNKDVYNYVRCLSNAENPDGSTGGKYAKFCRERTFTFSCAERENADSRIFMGVHWIFDADDGIVLGNQVASHVVRTALKDKSGGVQPVLFSAPPGLKRADLICRDTAWPDGWEEAFGAKDFVTTEIR